MCIVHACERRNSEIFVRRIDACKRSTNQCLLVELPNGTYRLLVMDSKNQPNQLEYHVQHPN